MENPREKSLNASMNGAVKHYSSMFSLPSYKKALLTLAAICIIGVNFCVFALFHSINSLFLGIILFGVTFLIETTLCKSILRDDPIFSVRRTFVLALFSWGVWLAFIGLGTGLGFAFGSLVWVKMVLLGFAAVITLRTLVFSSTTDISTWKQIVSTFSMPIICIIVFVVFWMGLPNFNVWQALPFLVGAPIISYIAVYIFLASIDRLGKTNYSLPALPMFKAFLLNWVTDINEPLEKFLEGMGENSDIEVSILKFDASKPKAAIILPLVHPGPFKNIGSSLLPSRMKREFEGAFGCEACVPLGILGHELDLASQTQNQKIISQVIAKARFESNSPLASPSVKVTEGYATACCQIFGETAFLSFSLSPKTTEDLPQELGQLVLKEAKKYGLTSAIVVNAHNSLTDVVDVEEQLSSLKIAASKCLEQAVSLSTKSFQVGAATVFPKEFTLKQGMGPGGITVIVVKVENQKTAYVVIDGNNMISGFREEILASLNTLEFGACEVFTTDTHAVNGMVTGRRGYNPVGAVMDHKLIINYINEAAKKALSNLEPVKAGFLHLVVPQIRVIGEEKLHSITNLVDKAIVLAKKIVAPIFGVEGLLLILLLLLF